MRPRGVKESVSKNGSGDLKRQTRAHLALIFPGMIDFAVTHLSTFLRRVREGESLKTLNRVNKLPS